MIKYIPYDIKIINRNVRIGSPYSIPICPIKVKVSSDGCEAYAVLVLKRGVVRANGLLPSIMKFAKTAAKLSIVHYTD